MARRVRLSPLAQADIAAILRWSEERFGALARQRCSALISATLRDLSLDPNRVGSRERPEVGAGLWSYHLHFRRKRSSAGAGLVRRARHLVRYRLEADGAVAFSRVLHDAMELERHLPPPDADAGP